MRGFFRWFKSGAKMKRWILMILIGFALASYGMVRIVTEERFDFVPLAQIILLFVIGFVFVIIGLVQMQKRTLEMFVQETDSRVDDKNNNINTLIYNRKIYDQGPKIVAIGGGTGLSSVLKGLKNYTDNITAIVTVSDYGEATPESRRKLNAMPLDDIKDSFVALSKDEELMNNLLNTKFNNGVLKDLAFGDIYLTGMKQVCGDFTLSVEKSKDLLNITGRVLPVTLEPIQICAELEDGTVIESKDRIPDIVNTKTSKISRIYINPTNCRVAPGVLEAIQEADAIVIGPGSLYTNVIPNLLVKGVAKEIKESKAFKVYVSNIMTEQGQTDNYKLSDHIKAIHEHTGKGVIKYCIYDTGELIPEYIRKYNMQGQELVEIDSSETKAQDVYLMQREISHVSGEHIRHNPDAIAASIIQLICDDLKFRDMQNDTKYVLLNDRLKEAKRNLKTSKKNDNMRKTKKKKPKGQSRFFEKYSERIESIKESDIKMQAKEQNNKKKTSKH
ncbi:MAG: uridine diphosphate-N-acetylglucosamine-binding protein YvcK [Clostridiales bacterium]|nr:uridine diphosphate-N-acetylglucosamine-binding protein YvcK [Clostridiales bacterium]